jgi:hypothetical protein
MKPEEIYKVTMQIRHQSKNRRFYQLDFNKPGINPSLAISRIT